MTVTRSGSTYTINANLHRGVTTCPHCGSSGLKMHGRFLIQLADLPYIDEHDASHSVGYVITAQRYLCDSCGRGVAEPLPAALAPAVTTSRITRRLSCWLLYMLQTETPYDHIARTSGYSKVWVRKWYTEVRAIYGLGAKPSKPGRKPKEEVAIG
jgi:transposase-like protein